MSSVVNGRWTTTTLDGLGRTIEVQNGTGTSPGYSIVNQTDTVYDSCGCSPLGKLKQTSLPHAPGSGAVWTTYTYDGIGRTLSVLQPDGYSTTTYSYQGNVVTVTDPAGAWKIYTSDAFGRLTQVQEPNPAGGSFYTYYTYDLLDHLTGVSMPRPTGTQTRSFVYSNTAFLQSATNPENGTVTYTYDSYNRLSDGGGCQESKESIYLRQLQPPDPGAAIRVFGRRLRGRYVCSEPMFLLRLKSIRHLDKRIWAARGGAVLRGQLQFLCIPSGTPSGCDLLQEWYSYDAAGASLSKTLQVTRGGSSGSLTASWTYDSEGRVTAVTYPTSSGASGSNYTFAYDTMGRLNTMTDTINSHTLISGMTYGRWRTKYSR